MSLTNFDKLIYKDKDEDSLKNKHKLAPTWDRQTFRVLLCGKTGCGKTNFLLNMLLKFMNFEEIHILTKIIDEKPYKWLRETLEPVEDEIGRQIIFMYNDMEDMPEPSELEDDVHRIIIFDDQVGEKKQEKIIDYFKLGRKVKCGCFYLSQEYFQTPKIIRNQCDYFALFKFPSDNEMSRLHSELANDIPKNVFKDMIKYCTKDVGSCLFIDKKDNKMPYRKDCVDRIKLKSK